MPKKPKESLVDWLHRTSPDLKKPASSEKPPATRAPAKPATNGPRWVTLKDWAHLMFGEKIPHRQTLQRWVREGFIQPPPQKIGKAYYVKPDAEYRE